ncbi:talin-2-like [Tropilaelaps mercedesae]|uniref:Talin-2-like n=1 Tax=Tropilaelaps mercedesae TaxID=418985 RepID=A0A1V9X1Q7_9ACAR|nr:talin-2-like [Tropilaelaps mercedesae]
MQTLKKKLKTDDDLNWVDHCKTLRELGINEEETLTLRRKYFFSDSNVDSRDPVQLNLIYVQARDAILNTTHPVTVDEACEFAGLQCQIQFGNQKEGMHKSGSLELKEFLPKGYTKIKSIDKRIFDLHKKAHGLSEVDAKVKYVQRARSLKTYGVTFFLVKEKMKGKNKLVPRLLGITKESVMRLDERTKEIMKVWPLTTVRRWAASPNSFTLDFGNYLDRFYSMKTPEGEQIARLIAGYIDIILKRQKAKDHIGIEGDEGSTMVEDSVSPAKASTIQLTPAIQPVQFEAQNIAIPSVVRPSPESEKIGLPGHAPVTQHKTETGTLSQGQRVQIPPQQAHVATLIESPQRAVITEAIKKSFDHLNRPIVYVDLGKDPGSKKWKECQLDTHKQNIQTHIAAMNAATAHVVTLASAVEVDAPAVSKAINVITTTLPEMTKHVATMATLIEDDRDRGDLIDAARQMCKAFSDLLNAAEPVGPPQPQKLVVAAAEVAEKTKAVLSSIAEEPEWDRETADLLLALAKGVANAAATLIRKAKDVASQTLDQDLRNSIINAATQGGAATQRLVSSTKVLAPTIADVACQTELENAGRDVSRTVDNIVMVCQGATEDATLLQDLQDAARQVANALQELLGQVKDISVRAREARTEAYHGPVTTIMDATDRLFDSSGDATEMVRQAKILASATAQLIHGIRGDAEQQSDARQQKRLLQAATVLADATTRMIEAAKGCAGKPNDCESQAMLRKAAEDIRMATDAASGNAVQKKVIQRLETTAKQTAAAARQNISAAHSAVPQSSNESLSRQLTEQMREVEGVLPRLMQGVKATQTSSSIDSQLELIYACEDVTRPCEAMASTSKQLAATIMETTTSQLLHTRAMEMTSVLTEMRTWVTKAKTVCGQKVEDLSGPLGTIDSLQRDLREYRHATEMHDLRPLPGENSEVCALKLGATSKVVGSSLAQILTAASQSDKDYLLVAARDTANALKEFVSAVRGVAACSDEQDAQLGIIDNAAVVVMRARDLITASQDVTNNPLNPDNQHRLTSVGKQVSASLTSCIGILPGQKAVDDAIAAISESTHSLNEGLYPASARSYGDLQAELQSAAQRLHESTDNVVDSARLSSSKLTTSVRRFGADFDNLFDVGLQLAGQTQSSDIHPRITTSLRNVAISSSKLLVVSKTTAADHSASAKSQLIAAGRAVVDSINQLIDVCSSAAPGQRECDNAIRAIQSAKTHLEEANEPISDLSYFECLDFIMEKSKMLGDGMVGITDTAKESQHEQFCAAVKQTCNAVCGLIEASAQAAYLIGASEPSSVAGRLGLIDAAQMARSSQAIEQACFQLTSERSDQVLLAATVIAKHTSSICNSCRIASTKATSEAAKRPFMQSAKDVAAATANLVREIKALDQDPSEANRRVCHQATKPLIAAVENVAAFASSPEFATVPAQLSHKALQAQEPILGAARNTVLGVCNLLRHSKDLAINPRDPPVWQGFSNESRTVSDSIKRLVTVIKESAPGQKECMLAIERLNAAIRTVDQASIAVIRQASSLPPPQLDLHTSQEQINHACQAIQQSLEPLRVAAKCQAEQLGHCVLQLVSYFDSLIQNTLEAAGRIISNKQQMHLLDLAKTVCEAAVQFLYTAKEGGGNPKAPDMLHNDIDEGADATRDAVNDLVQTLERFAADAGVVNGVLESINNAIAELDKPVVVTQRESSFAEVQTDMDRSAKEIARIAGEMVHKSVRDHRQLSHLASELSHHYATLVATSRTAISVTSNSELAYRIRLKVHDLGTACVDLCRSCGSAQANPDDAGCHRDLIDAAKQTSEGVSHILAALKAGSRGTQACINAASTVSGIIGDLDTTIMFATAGSLNPERDGDKFGYHREDILKTAKALVDDTKSLVAGAASSQEQLATAAQNAVQTIVLLADVVKQGAASLGPQNQEAQVMLINAVKDVALALGDLIQATKVASGKSINDPSMLNLKDSAKVMVTNVTSLLKTVRAVEDEHSRGSRALEATIEAIFQEIRTFDSADTTGLRQVTPEELVRSTKLVTQATAKAVVAGTSCKQEDAIVTANMGRKAITDMLQMCKSASLLAENAELKTRVLKSGRECAVRYRELLQEVLKVLEAQTGAAGEGRQRLEEGSRAIAMAVGEMVSASEALKGHDLDPEDPTVIAGTELLGAAASIDAAAKKLANLRPREITVKVADENLNFDELILEAAKSITAATAALIKAAAMAQRDLVAAGMVSGQPRYHSEDGQWSEGLVSAARLVAAATHSLVEAANALVHGEASEEKLISSAKQVASSTAQLLVACKVKSSPDSPTMKRLQTAGNAVKQATESLVRAARRYIEQTEEFQLVINKQVSILQTQLTIRMVGGIAQEIVAREEILRKERELEEARERLVQLRKAKYVTSHRQAQMEATTSTAQTDAASQMLCQSSSTQSVQQQGQTYAGSETYSAYTYHSSESSQSTTHKQ